MFSGGVDSTYVVDRVAPQFDKIFLHTYVTPGMIKAERSILSAEQLKRLHDDKIEHHIIDIKDFVYSVRGNALKCIKDNVKYHFMYAWCLGCKVAMHLYAIRECKALDVKIVYDASNFYDIHALEQHEKAKIAISGIYEQHGIVYNSPFYYESEKGDFKPPEEAPNRMKLIKQHLSLEKETTKFRLKYLKKRGINLGNGFMDMYRCTQPSCTTSIFFNGLRVALKPFIAEAVEGYQLYIKDKANDAAYKA